MSFLPNICPPKDAFFQHSKSVYSHLNYSPGNELEAKGDPETPQICLAAYQSAFAVSSGDSAGQGWLESGQVFCRKAPDHPGQKAFSESPLGSYHLTSAAVQRRLTTFMAHDKNLFSQTCRYIQGVH